MSKHEHDFIAYLNERGCVFSYDNTKEKLTKGTTFSLLLELSKLLDKNLQPDAETYTAYAKQESNKDDWLVTLTADSLTYEGKELAQERLTLTPLEV